MVERAPGALSLPADWPVHPDLSLALNRMGSFDWDLGSGLMHLDQAALDVFDLYADEYDGRPETLARRVPPDEATRLDARVSQALKNGSTHYGAYFRIRRRDGSPRWTHTQGVIRRDGTGRPHRIIGIVRHAVQELADASVRIALDIEARRRTSVVEGTTAALAHARTVRDVINVLKDSRGLEYLGASSLVMGLVEVGRILLVAEGPEGSFVPGTRYTRVDERYPMSEVIRDLAPRFIDSAEDFAASYPELWPHIDGLGVSAAAYLPLIAQARPIGAIGLLYRDKVGFSADERNLLIALGSSVAQSLQRAMLYEQEHDLAQGLQQAMLPRRISEVPGAQVAVRYRSARIGRDIGGDWYDVIPLPSGRVGAVIGDVQGHDTHAAAVMGQLRIVLRAYAAEGHTPATVMSRASDFLHELDTERFATCLYAEADLATGVVQLVRAGHVDPLLRAPDGSCRRVPVEGDCPWVSPVNSASSTTRWPPWSWIPDTLCCCSPTVLSSSRAPISTTACSGSPAWSRAGRGICNCSPITCARPSTGMAARTMWRCCCSAGRGSTHRRVRAGCNSMWRSATPRRWAPHAIWSAPRHAPGAPGSGRTRSSWRPTSC